MALASAGLLIFTLPIFWIAYRIWKEDGRPILFRQQRIGRAEGRFSLWKFRTMTADGRITPFGNSLRAMAMDELPQLFNILTGDMSFVGPRPLIPEELRHVDVISGSDGRFSVRPGLTGLAQLCADKVPLLADRIRWDLTYLEQSSFPLDVRLLFQSVRVTLRKAWEKPGPKTTMRLRE